ncbi:hypothetical protein ACJMQP_20580 [Rhodopseudomonas palustris]
MQRLIFLVFGLLLPMAADANEAAPAIPHRCENCTSTPVEVATQSREMSDMCRSAGGTPRSGPDIQQGRFPDGPVFWAIDEATLACDGAAALFSTNHGAVVHIFVETNDGHAIQAFEHAAVGVTLERSSNANKVWLNVGGALCGQNTDGLSTADMRACQRPLKWDAVTRKLDFAPLSEIRDLPQAEDLEAQAGGLPANRIYDSGSELVNKRDYVLNEYWKDKIDLIPWKPRGATQGTIFNWPFASPDGRSLMVSLLQAPAVCTPKCPARFINAQHRVVLEIMVCADRTKHGFSPDNRTFIACGERFSIPQVDERTALLDNAPPGSNPEAYLEVQRRLRAQPKNRPEPIRVDSALHNDSQMLIREWKDGSVEIAYDVPKQTLPVVQGTLLFRGTRSGSNYQGTAFTFRDGCAPAPYEVRGYRDVKRELVVLTGAAPRRGRGCDIIGDSVRSNHARLVFDTRELGDK